jgi:ribosome-associated protein
VRVTETIHLNEGDINERYIQSPGPGGQHVNKAATGVQLRFDVHGSSSLPPEIKKRLMTIAGKRLNKDGVLIITAHGTRSREQNRRDARQRLAHLIRRATLVPKKRHKTSPPRAAREKRLRDKKHHSKKKQRRDATLGFDE